MRKAGRLIKRHQISFDECVIVYGEGGHDSSDTFDASTIEKRSKVVKYLMENNIMQWNPINFSKLVKATGINRQHLDYILHFGVSPLNAGVVEVVDEALIYLTDLEKAEAYLQMMEKMKSLL